MGVGAGLYMYDIVVKSSCSLSPLLMSSCFLCRGLVVHIHDKFSTETRQRAYALDVMHAFQVVRRGKIYRVS